MTRDVDARMKLEELKQEIRKVIKDMRTMADDYEKRAANYPEDIEALKWFDRGTANALQLWAWAIEQRTHISE